MDPQRGHMETRGIYELHNFMHLKIRNRAQYYQKVLLQPIKAQLLPSPRHVFRLQPAPVPSPRMLSVS
jgi:hypothetical protein